MIAINRFRFYPKLFEVRGPLCLRYMESVDLAYTQNKIDDPSQVAGVPVLILHGLLGARINWRTFSQHLKTSTNRETITIDLRNHGDSPATDQMYFPLHAKDISQLLDRLGQVNVVFMGHSMGGWISMYYALKNPDKVSSMVIVDVSPESKSNIEHFTKLFNTMKAAEEKIHPSASLREGRKIVADELSHVMHDDDIQSIVRNFVKDGDKVVWRGKALSKSYHEQASFPKEELEGHVFNGPVLFIGGSKSDFIVPSHEKEIKKYFPNSELTFIEGVGHMPHMEKPQELLTLVSAFLNRQ